MFLSFSPEKEEEEYIEKSPNPHPHPRTDDKPKQAARRKRVDPGDSLAQLKRREQREVRLSREVGQACSAWLTARGIRREPDDSRQGNA